MQLSHLLCPSKVSSFHERPRNGSKIAHQVSQLLAVLQIHDTSLSSMRTQHTEGVQDHLQRAAILELSLTDLSQQEKTASIDREALFSDSLCSRSNPLGS
ncbi:hypothetical protein O6H91_18G082700 [Diphasiastrum complanatum]|uniref:Uncharacterized protein n=2 Tax=Diphasiastrum complanatum TaxID=34168 RepID=A0ACC2B379_DIPCM|nr:hypothetical protein O6H91_18G082700 [Diphasiastrum complanatum]KAJ7524210.1 hypothetical protein O6H91_18G082700 [Diphasiastrum complanatum]